jgi:hypothetical protein
MKRGFSVLVLACLAVGACKRANVDAVSPEEAADLLINRNWMDHWPSSREERLFVYRFTPAMGGGVFQDRTLFAGSFELFTFSTSESRLTIEWPHRDVKESIPFRIEKVRGPRPFDLKLILDGNESGPSEYFGRSSETAADPLLLPTN